MLNMLRFVFVLATFEITLSRYLLVRVDQGHNPGTETLVSDVQSRTPHTNCWNCLAHYCTKKHPDMYEEFIQGCQQYERFPLKQLLVNCAISKCYKAENEIDDVCVDGIRATADSPPGTLGACRDETQL